MYGKKRIVINKQGQIILAGEKSWIPIGIAIKSDKTGVVVSKFLRFENRFDNKLSDNNSVKLSLVSMTQTRDTIRSLYNIKK